MTKAELVQQIKDGYKHVSILNYKKEADGKKILSSGTYNIELSLDWDYEELIKESLAKLKGINRDLRLATAKRLNESKVLKEGTTSDEIFTIIKDLITNYESKLVSFDSVKHEKAREESPFKVLTHGLEEKDEFLYFSGIELENKTIVEAKYKPVNSKDKTIIKNKIEDLLPISKFKKFKVPIDKLNSVTLTK